MLNMRNRFAFFDLPRASLFGQLLIGFDTWRTPARRRVTITYQSTARVHWNLERRRGFRTRGSVVARFSQGRRLCPVRPGREFRGDNF